MGKVGTWRAGRLEEAVPLCVERENGEGGRPGAPWSLLTSVWSLLTALWSLLTSVWSMLTFV